MKRSLVVFIQTVAVIANSQSCPFKATDANAISLASTTAGTIQGLLDSKNQCSANFTEAVRSVQGLPEMMATTRDPLRDLYVKRDFINSEIAKALSDPTLASSSMKFEYDNYLEYLIEQKTKNDRLIEHGKLNQKSSRKEDSQEKVVGLTWNLLSAASNAMSDPDSPCAKNISQKYGSQILTLGMGAVSSAGYLISSAAGGGITLAAGLLSQVMDLFNRMPPRALKEFEQTNQTLDLACLYHNIVSLSCNMKEVQGSSTKAQIEKEAKKIADNSLYSQVVTADEIKMDIGNIISAAVTQDLSIIAAGGSSAIDKELSESFGENTSASAKEEAESEIRKFEILKKYLVTDKVAYDGLTTSQKQYISNGLEYFIMNLGSAIRAEGISLESATGKVNYVEGFRNNFASFEKILKSKLVEAGGSSGADHSAFDNSVDLHRSINLKDSLAKTTYTRKMYENIKADLAAKNLDKTSDGKALLAQIQDTESVLDQYEKWLSADPSDPTYKTKLSQNAMELKKALKSRRDDSYSVRERVKEILALPLSKYQQIITQVNPTGSSDLFANPFKVTPKAVSDFDRFKALRDVYKQVSEPHVELRDQSLVTETRRLFEDKSSLLRDNFVAGLTGMQSRIASSPDPEVSKKMFSQLCGLAQSLPSSSSQHSIEACQGAIPQDMQGFVKTGSKETPDCSYHRYVKERTRSEYFNTGRSLSLPTESSKGTK